MDLFQNNVPLGEKGLAIGRAGAIAQRVGVTAPLHANVKGLSIAEKWLINICRALVRKASMARALGLRVNLCGDFLDELEHHQPAQYRLPA